MRNINVSFLWSLLLMGSISCSQSYDVEKNDSQNLITEVPGGGGETPAQERVVTDVFNVSPATRSVDILFVIDNSGSMKEEQENLARSFNLFIQDMQSNDLDFQIGIISNDPSRPSSSTPLGSVAWTDTDFSGAYEGIDNMGAGSLLSSRGTPRVLTRDTPDLISKFKSNVDIGIGAIGYEMGIQSLIYAFSPELSGVGKWNAPLFRDDALLSIVIVSDEDETRRYGEYNQYLRDYPSEKSARLLSFDNAAMELKKNRRGLLRVDAIVSDPTNQCSSAKKDGVTYSEFARAYGGSVFDICDDFSGVLSALGSSINEQTISTFSLKKKAESLQSLKLNGVELVLNSSYTFNPLTNTITLVGNALETVKNGGGSLEIIYVTRQK